MTRPASRRSFLGQTAWGCAGAALLGTGCSTPQGRRAALVMTVHGPIRADQLGVALTHEHVVVDFIGADKTNPDRYDPEAAFHTAWPHFQRLKAAGVASLMECTPAYLGRNVALLKRLSAASGVHILTNSGYYGAVNSKYLPRHAFTETTGQLADRWLREWSEGIDGTGVRPGFLKLGTGDGQLPETHAKLLRAGARVHLETGLTIAVHTGNGGAALDELRILREEGVAPEAFIWVHAQSDSGAIQIEAARSGAWVSLDGYSLAPGNPERYLKFLLNLKAARLLHRVLISHDDGWAVEGDGPRGGLKLFANGNPDPYRSIRDRFLPALRDAGFTQAELDQLQIHNPHAAFAIRVRKLA